MCMHVYDRTFWEDKYQRNLVRWKLHCSAPAWSSQNLGRVQLGPLILITSTMLRESNTKIENKIKAGITKSWMCSTWTADPDPDQLHNAMMISPSQVSPTLKKVNVCWALQVNIFLLMLYILKILSWYHLYLMDFIIIMKVAMKVIMFLIYNFI